MPRNRVHPFSKKGAPDLKKGCTRFLTRCLWKRILYSTFHRVHNDTDFSKALVREHTWLSSTLRVLYTVWHILTSCLRSRHTWLHLCDMGMPAMQARGRVVYVIQYP
jgi:hypothetical protein